MPHSTLTGSDLRARYQPLVTVFAAACVGIALDRYAGLPLLPWWSMAAMCCGAWCVLWRRGNDRLAAGMLLLAVLATGGAWHHCRWSLFEIDDLRRFASDVPGPAALEVEAVGGPRRVPSPPFDAMRTMSTPERTRMQVRVRAIRDQDVWRPASGLLTISVDGHVLGIRPGDRVRVFGQLGAVRPAANPGEFDFALRARAERRLCYVFSEFPDCVTRLDAKSWSVRAAIDQVRVQGERLLWSSLGPRNAGLAAAMFLGSREELDPDESQTFLETGTIHLLVISGLNVGILCGCVFAAMRLALVPRGWALAGVAAACIGYAAVTDAQPPVVRATVMVLMTCLAVSVGRRPLAYNNIAAAGLVVLALNPTELFQSGTQLSFLSVAALAWLSERRAAAPPRHPLDRLIARTRPWPVRTMRWASLEVARLTWVSLVIWLVICPLVMTRFHLVSPVAILLGPLLALPVTFAMASGFGVFAVGWLAPPLADLFGRLCDANLQFLEYTVAWASRLPANHFWVSGPSDWWLAGFYLALGCWVFLPHRAPPRRWCLALLAGWTLCGVTASWFARFDADRLRCTVLSVGHGTAVVIELPDGKTLLYDAGRLGSPSGASRAVSSYLWSRGITHLDAVIISHADADHYNAMPSLARQFSLGAVYVSPVMFEQPDRALSALRDAITRADVPLARIAGGDRLRVGGQVNIEVVHPPRGGVLGSDNANSIVLAIEYQRRRILLTGDLESPGLDDVLAEEPYDVDVLLTPHHGSANSDPPGFAAWSTPEFAIVSGGLRDRLEAVDTAYRAVGCQVLHTADAGAVQVSISPDALSVRCWHPGNE